VKAKFIIALKNTIHKKKALDLNFRKKVRVNKRIYDLKTLVSGLKKDVRL
jgi:hypothetical protein